MNFFEIEVNNYKVPDLKDAYDKIRHSLGEETFLEYTALLKRFFNLTTSKVQFDEDARKLLGTYEQVHLHNLLLLSLLSKLEVNRSIQNLVRQEPVENVPPAIPGDAGWEMEPNVRCVTQEMCLPDRDFVRGRLLVSCLDHSLEGSDDDAVNMIIVAVQMFVKNIVTALASKISGYSIRENNFQHSIGMPVPNPWIRNTSNIIDSNQESNIELAAEQGTFAPRIKDSLEMAQQRMAHRYACSTNYSQSHRRITLKLMYETLLYNPQIINCHSVYAPCLEKIVSLLDCS